MTLNYAAAFMWLSLSLSDQPIRDARKTSRWKRIPSVAEMVCCRRS